MMKNKQLLMQQQQFMEPMVVAYPPLTAVATSIPTSDLSTISYTETVTPQLTRAASNPPSLANNPSMASTLVNTNTTGCSSMAINCNSQYQADLASVDSSDTYASCQTHPFFSQGDLTSDVMDSAYAIDYDTNNLYINPLEKETMGLIGGYGGKSIKVKKSASGDVALRNIGTDGSFENEAEFQTFQTFGISTEPRGSSSTSLNETPVPKHRKTRFQSQPNKPRARFEEVKRSQDSIDRSSNMQQKKTKRKIFEAKSIASATKLINQHLFGHHPSLPTKGEFLSTKG